MMKHSDVTISIICHTAFESCQRTLSAVLNTREGAQLILTANGNAEAAEHFEKLSRQRDGIRVVNNLQNLGFIGPSNEAFKMCDMEFFVLLNDDAIPAPDWLEGLKWPLCEPKAVISGPGVRWLDNRFVGHRMDFQHQRADYIEGSCMMVKVDLVLPGTLFSPELQFAYAEDADLCLRMRANGLTIHETPFELRHNPGTTTRTVPHLHEIMKKNIEFCANKWARYLETRSFE